MTDQTAVVQIANKQVTRHARRREMSNRLLRLDEVLELCGISRSELYRQMAEKKFPRPVRVGVRAVRWRQSDVDEWIQKRPKVTV